MVIGLAIFSSLDDPIWKEELERLTKHVVARAAMGRPATMHGPRSQSRLLQSRSANRSDPVLAALDDTTVSIMKRCLVCFVSKSLLDFGVALPHLANGFYSYNTGVAQFGTR